MRSNKKRTERQAEEKEERSVKATAGCNLTCAKHDVKDTARMAVKTTAKQR